MSWSDKLKGAISAVKDTGAAAAMQHWLSREMADYGELLDFKFSSRTRSAEMHVLLKGETSPLTVQVNDYEMIRQGDSDYVVVKSATASREWVNAVLRNFVIQKPHRIPARFGGMAKMVLNG
jgi:hypothetical protein